VQTGPSARALAVCRPMEETASPMDGSASVARSRPEPPPAGPRPVVRATSYCGGTGPDVTRVLPFRVEASCARR
jgi:hypothetical protein